jgi:hypothetical protein
MQQPDPELEALKKQVLEGRKREKDYRNIEDQIRCLKLRLNQQQHDEGHETTEHEQASE